MFFEYKISFNFCDIFDQDLADRTFPFTNRKSNADSDYLSNWNYIFSYILQNTYNIYLDIFPKEDKKLNFPDFCKEFFFDILMKDIVHDNKYI